MNIIERIKAVNNRKKIEAKMVELYKDFPMLDDLRLFIEAHFALFPDLKSDATAATTMLIQGFAIHKPVYYCECMKSDTGDDWVRMDEVRNAGLTAKFDLVNNKVIKNGVVATLLRVSNNKDDVIKAYNDYKAAQK